MSERITLHHGDCREVLATMPDCSVDSVVTDPPYELGFMGKKWDASGIAYNVELWRECLRVLKPGGHLLAFGGTRTYHRMAVAIEDAGFEIRDSIHWMYGSGFPKSLDVSKAIDKQAGAEREVIDSQHRQGRAAGILGTTVEIVRDITAPATDAAKQWEGWGTALKPAHEPIVVARKPLIGTVAANVLEHGTGALNIDGCRVDMGDEYDPTKMQRQQNSAGAIDGAFGAAALIGKEIPTYKPGGRWPANIVLTHAADCGDTCTDGCPVSALDAQQDGASRFFTVTEWSDIDVPFQYVAKPSRAERNAGLDQLPEHDKPGVYTGRTDGTLDGQTTKPRANFHPTVKPLALMRWLVRLVTPPGGTVLEPFAGSGTTLMAAIMEGFHAIGIELTEEYLPIIEGRCAWAEQQPQQLSW